MNTEDKKQGKSAELLIASWVLDSGFEVFLPAAQDVQADLVVLARDDRLRKFATIDGLPDPQRFEPNNSTTCVRCFGNPEPPHIKGQRWLFAIEVKTGESHKENSIDFDYLVFLDQERGEGAISLAGRYASGKPSHFPKDNLPTRTALPAGWIFLPEAIAGSHSTIVYFGLPIVAQKRAEFFMRVFVTFALGFLR